MSNTFYVRKTMDLQVLGFDDWFSDHAVTVLQPEQNLARVIAVDRNACLAQGDGQETPAELSGRFR